jgi:Cdc6-like AAA superfamily ATPase
MLEQAKIKLSNKDFDRVLDLIRESLFALDAEIEAVRERPARDTFENGVYTPKKSSEEHDYVFKSTNSSIRFAEKIQAKIGNRALQASFVDANEDEIVLRFAEHAGPQISSVDLEWENDFVLRRMQDQLLQLQMNEDDEKFARIAQLFFHQHAHKVDPQDYSKMLYEYGEIDIVHDGNRNEAQCESIQKALYNPVSFIWGPPGTGKTSTLGYVVANLVLQDKKVLFLSNTNRAVDVGMLAIMDALHAIKESAKIGQLNRYGDIALSAEALERIHHEKLVEVRRGRIKQKAALFQDLLSKLKGLQNEIEAIELDGGYASPEIENQLDALLSEARKHGGIRKMADLCENLQYQLVNADFMEVSSKQVVGTTLARICTSELFNGMEFDAVVIDEASMASLPYLVIMASRCKMNLVIAGDPMQLPPIALTNDERARKQLEQDIFAYASSASHPDELFQWHDQNPLTTSFFDVQYRLHADLAAIISDVFYDGRLRSHESVTNIDKRRTQKGITRSFRVINTSKHDPVLSQKSKEYGFSPRNEVHLAIVADLVYQLVTKDLIPMEHIGIIVPFRSSVWDIRVELKKKGLGDVEVGTIHTYQGREKRVIIFDTVMTGELKQGRVSHFSVRPFDEKKNGLSVPRLLNVAFSRARGELFVLADMRHIEKVYGNKFLGKLLTRLM